MSDLYALPLPRNVFRVYVTVVLAFLILPALIVVPVSFSAGSIIAFPLPGFSTRWYAEAVESVAWRNALENSLIIGLGAALLATALGLGGALGIDRLSPRLRSLALLLSLIPFVVPVVLIALGGFLALAVLGLNNTYVGIIILHAAMGVPFVVISVTASFARLRPQSPARRRRPWRIACRGFSPDHAADDLAGRLDRRRIRVRDVVR